MTKEEILENYSIDFDGIICIDIDQALLAMQHYADQETESLRQQNANLAEALKAAGAELLQFVPITDVKVLDQINKALKT